MIHQNHKNGGRWIFYGMPAQMTGGWTNLSAHIWWWSSSSSSPPTIIHPYSDIVPSIYYEYYIYTYYYTLIMIIMISLYTILPLSSLSHTLLVLDHPTPNATFRLRHRRSRGPSAAATPGRSLRTSSKAAAVEVMETRGMEDHIGAAPPRGWLIEWVLLIPTWHYIWNNIILEYAWISMFI